jgi:nicotinamidase-related amidase
VNTSRLFARSTVPAVEMPRDRTALLIIDMQYHDASEDQGASLAYEKLEPGSMMYFIRRNEEIVVPTIARLLEYFRSEDMTVIFVTLGSQYRDLRDVPGTIRSQVRELEAESGVEDILWAGNPAFAVRAEIAPRDEETVVNKTSWGAFNSSNIELVLHQLGVKTLVVTGVSTSCCVETTARDAADRGFGCVIVDEGTADYDEQAHREALRAFELYFGRVARSASDVIKAIDFNGAI